MKEFWKNTGKIAGTLVQWAFYLGCIVSIGFIAKVTWLSLRFGWRLM